MKELARARLRVPRTIWVAWCHTCRSWLDETESAPHSIDMALNEYPEHFDPGSDPPCRVEVIPFRADRANAKPVKA